MTAEQALQAWLKMTSLPMPPRLTVQFGLFTQPVGRSHCGSLCDGPPLYDHPAYVYHWFSCSSAGNLPVTRCWNWLVLDANAGFQIMRLPYFEPHGPGS